MYGSAAYTVDEMPDQQMTVTEKEITFDLTARPEETRSYIDGTVISAMGLEASGEGANFNQPVYFFNYCTITDEDAEDTYRSGLKPHLTRVGADMTFSNIENRTRANFVRIPKKDPVPKMLWVHRQMELVRYLRPENWADMATHPDVFKIMHYKFLGAGGDFNVIVQESIFGTPYSMHMKVMPRNNPMAGRPGSAKLLHCFNLAPNKPDKFRQYLEPLKKELLDYNMGRLTYAGRTIAKPYSVLKNGKRLTQKGWMDGSIIISLNRNYDTDRIMSLPSYTRFMEAAQNNAITLFA